MRNLSRLIVAGICFLAPMTASCQQAHDACPLSKDQKADPTKLPSCSYSALNGNCRLTINRFNPVTPPTIYVKPACVVRVLVRANNSYRLEHLTLDWKQGSIVLPPDVLSTVFTAISPSLGKLTVVKSQSNFAKFACENALYLCPDPAAVSEAQQRILQQIAEADPVPKLKDTITDINTALLPPPVPLPASNGSPQPWSDPEGWKKQTTDKIDAKIPSEDFVKLLHRNRLTLDADVSKFVTESQAAVKTAQQDGAAATKAIQSAQDDNAKADQAIRDHTPHAEDAKRKAEDALKTAQNAQTKAESDLQTASVTALAAEDLSANETYVDQNDDEFETLVRRFEALSAGIKGLSSTPGGIEGVNTIVNPNPTDKNYQNQVWNLNYANVLQPITKRVAADALKSTSSASLGGIADPSPKQTIIAITVQFQNPLPIEASAVLMVPFTPYHSYAKATDSSGNPIALQTTSYALVPIALISVPTIQWIVHKQPAALFISGGVGVNSVTSAVEFGAGLTYAYRSFEISGLVDIGRETEPSRPSIAVRIL